MAGNNKDFDEDYDDSSIKGFPNELLIILEK